jgi:hypothetical protein
MLNPEAVQLRHGRAQLAEDWRMFRAGVLDRRSFRAGWTPMLNPVEVRTTSVVSDTADVDPSLIVHDPNAFTEPAIRTDGLWGEATCGMERRVYREIRRQHNLQLDVGKNQIQRILSFGDVGAGLNGSFAAYTATTATTLTGSSGLPTGASGAGNTGLQGKICYVTNATVANSVFGVIVTNTATVITVDQWYAIPVTGAAGTTPTSAAGTACILPGGTWAWWVGLSTSVAAAAAADVTRTADGLWGDGTGGGTATETVASGMTRAYCGQGGGTAPTLPATKQLQFNHTWTYGTTGSLTIGTVVLFNSLAFAGTIPLLETLLSATATVAAVSDTIQLAGWLITC